MKELKREDFFNQEIRMEKVEIPEWDSFVYVRSMSAKDRDEMEGEAAIRNQRGEGLYTKDLRSLMTAKCVCDSEGNLLFKNGDFERLGDVDGQALSRIVPVALRLSGITEEDVEQIVGNLKSGTSEDSVTK